MNKKTKPLNQIAENKKVRIIKIDAGKALSMRINNLGILEGDTVRIIHNARGPLIIGKGHMRLALGRGMSQKIIVEEK